MPAVTINFPIIDLKETYTDNDGYRNFAYCWDGEIITCIEYANGYIGGKHDDYSVNATHEQKQAAYEWYCRTQVPSRSTIGCKWKVRNSRKFKRGTLVTTLAYDPGDRFTSEAVRCQSDAGEVFWISPNCLDEFVAGVTPAWLK